MKRNWHKAARALSSLAKDYGRVVDAAERGGARRPRVSALGDASVWALGGMRVATALRAVTGSSFGLNHALRIVFHIDAWSDDIGGGLRLPHPFGIVIGEGARIEEGCTLMHNVTLQRGRGTHIERGAVIGTGAVILGGSRVGEQALVGANSVVRGEIPARMVAVGAPARAVRAATHEELS
ncbi:MAG: hypothetical protein HOW73_02255 [Polyangiaceae bacterium]|nr:hypothetical protein [Polyangiaceae bacterium]